VATINVGQGASFLAVGPDAVRVIAAAADAVWVVVTDDALAEKIMPSAWTACAGRETITPDRSNNVQLTGLPSS